MAAAAIILCGPSGSGKSTIAQALEATGRFRECVSCTTRPPRPGEREGVHYRFLDDAAFERLEASGALLESERIHGHRYGMPADAPARAARDGRTPVLAVGPGGMRAAKRAIHQALAVLVKPPSREETERRLTASRGGEQAKWRMRAYDRIMAAEADCDATVLNERLEDAVQAVLALSRHAPRRPEADPAPTAKPQPLDGASKPS